MTVFRIARALVAFICGWSLFINKVLASHVFGLSMLHENKDPFSVLRTPRAREYVETIPACILIHTHWVRPIQNWVVSEWYARVSLPMRSIECSRCLREVLYTYILGFLRFCRCAMAGRDGGQR